MISTKFEPVAGQWYPDISIEDYHGGPGVSRTQLHKLLDPNSCPAKFHYEQGQPQESRSAFDVGNAGECLFLEPHNFASRWVAEPSIYEGPETKNASHGEPLNKRKKDHREWLEEWTASLPAGVSVISQDDYAMARACADALLGDPLIRRVLGSEPLIGVSHYGIDEQTGLLIKARTDAENDYLVDVKTARDASPNGFRKSAELFGYGMQASQYLDVVEQTRGERPAGFAFVVVEKTPPYLTAVYHAEPDMIALGRQDCRRALDLYHECMSTGVWPSYSAAGVQPLNLSRWEAARLDPENYL